MTLLEFWFSGCLFCLKQGYLFESKLQYFIFNQLIQSINQGLNYFIHTCLRVLSINVYVTDA